MEIMKFILLHLLTTICRIYCFGGRDHDDITMVCTNRFEYRYEMKNEYKNCTRVLELNPICAKHITIVYESHPPYVYKENGTIMGVLPAMIDYALQTCCFDCHSVEYIGPFTGMDKFHQHTTLVLPIQTSINTKKYFGHDYVHMFEIKAVNFIGPEIKKKPDEIIQIIFNSVLSTWPLFATSILMAVTAGVTMWVLDHGYNQDEFPNSFPRGPFEGFWWAVVSMTTVGYGDRSPRSVPARLFATFWILIGITIFSMYSATLTTSMMTAVIASNHVPLETKTFGVINTTTVGSIAAMTQRASSRGYGSLEEIQGAIISKEVHGIVVDEYMADYYREHMHDVHAIRYELYERLMVSGSSYGFMSYDANLTQLFTSFYTSNDDQRDIMAMMGMGEHLFDNSFKKISTDSLMFFGSREMFSSTLLSLVITTIILLILGLFLRKRGKGRRPFKKVSKVNKDAVRVETGLFNGTLSKAEDKTKINTKKDTLTYWSYISAL